jgi:hypothetical protein
LFVHSFLAALVILGLAAVPARATDTPSKASYTYARIVRLSFVSGDVQIVRTDKSNKWEPAVMNMPVEQGFAIGTNNGRAEIEFEQGSTLWLADNSVVQFTELALSNGGRITRVTLSEGTATFNTSLAAGDKFEVAAPSFRIDPSNKTEFRVDLSGKNGTVRVLGGKVNVGTDAGTQEVPKGQTAELKGKSAEFALERNSSTDEWDHWVATRISAKNVEANHTALYADSPFTYGMADLATYGTWSYYPGYGYGWQPWGVAAGWAPFADGGWAMYPSLGWTWVSAEPWGWVPYHFGSWQYSPAFGWMWMPGNYGMWSAAPVQWFSMGNHIGWAPAGVNMRQPTSTSIPVIVSTKALGKEGKIHVYPVGAIAGRIEAVGSVPTENGKLLEAGTSLAAGRAIVPTVSNLTALRANLGNSAGKVNISALHQAATSAPEREVMPVNAGMVAPRVPTRPPSRAFGPSDNALERLSGEPVGATPTNTTHSVPAATTHPSSAASASGGHPR